MKQIIIETTHRLTHFEEVALAKHLIKFKKVMELFKTPDKVLPALSGKEKEAFKEAYNGNMLQAFFDGIVNGIILDDSEKENNRYVFTMLIHPFPEKLVDMLLNGVARKLKKQFRFIKSATLITVKPNEKP